MAAAASGFFSTVGGGGRERERRVRFKGFSEGIKFRYRLRFWGEVKNGGWESFINLNYFILKARFSSPF